MRVLLVAALLCVAGCKRAPEDVACGPKGATYMSCGCGCCPGSEDVAEVECVDTSRGDTLGSLETKDKALRASGMCATMGCSKGTLYKCCD